jgi:hypothetical protein
VTRSDALTRTQQKELIESVHSFRHWLTETIPHQTLENYTVFECVEPTPEDWIMRVNRATRVVEFNPAVASGCSLGYFEMIVIHECFHLFAQRLPNKEEARMIKANFGDHMMKTLDIEADFFTALYFRDVKGATLADVLSHYSEGSRVFGDPKLLNWKFERFIGSILSVCNAFLSPDHSNNGAASTDVFIPTINGVHTEDRLYVVRFRGTHCALVEIAATADDFSRLKRAYTNKSALSKYDYVSLVVGFASAALGLSVPEQVEADIATLQGDA